VTALKPHPVVSLYAVKRTVDVLGFKLHHVERTRVTVRPWPKLDINCPVRSDRSRKRAWEYFSQPPPWWLHYCTSTLPVREW
jgi:hypothetical protein